jgi:hypothetical protein
MTHTKWFNEDGSRMTCSHEDCQALVHVSGLCTSHYSRAYKRGEQPLTLHYLTRNKGPQTCCQLDCERTVKARGLCQLHYERAVRSGKPRKTWRQTKWTNADGTRKTCKVPGCEKPVKTSGWCSTHYYSEWNAKNRPNTMTVCPIPGCGRPMIHRSSVCGKCNQTRWRYGLDPEIFLEMMQPENRKCSNPMCGATENLHIDHDHSCCPPGVFPTHTRVSCGKCVRGWLCQSCNRALGCVGDDVSRLLGLVAFLEQNKTPTSR